MDPFNQIFEYLPAQRIAVCKIHKQAVIKSQLQTHLHTKHREYSAGTRRKIVAAVQEEKSLQQWASTPKGIIVPSATSTPLPHLVVYRDGLQCSQCLYIVRNIQRMRDHVKGHHIERRSQGPARVRPLETSMFSIVTCQKFHNAGPLGQLFQVNTEQAAPSVTFDPDSAVSQAVEKSLTQARAAADALDAEHNDTIEADTNRYEYSQWLARAGWARHLRGLSRAWLLAMTKKPAHSEG